MRNNATRALGVLVGQIRHLAAEIPPDTFNEMLNSGVWSDRNKGSSLLMQLTVERSPDLLAKLRSVVFDSLVEMATWRRPGHAFFSRIILGRVAGLPEDRLQKLAWNGPVDAITTAAVGRP